MGNILPFPESNNTGGPHDPMLEKRVDRLEDDAREMQKNLTEIRTSLAKIEGSLSRIPGSMQLWSMTIGTWIAGAGIVALLLRLM